jgi:hypothetical protein
MYTDDLRGADLTADWLSPLFSTPLSPSTIDLAVDHIVPEAGGVARWWCERQAAKELLTVYPHIMIRVLSHRPGSHFFCESLAEIEVTQEAIKAVCAAVVIHSTWTTLLNFLKAEMPPLTPRGRETAQEPRPSPITPVPHKKQRVEA